MRRRAKPEMTRQAVGRDRGWKSKSVCVDGPAGSLALGRYVEPGERVIVRVSVDDTTRSAIYESIGEHPSVPPADGVALKFIGYENEPATTSDGDARVLATRPGKERNG